MFDATTGTAHAYFEGDVALPHADFGTPVDPEAGWAMRNPDRAMLFLFVSPRSCGAVDELMAI